MWKQVISPFFPRSKSNCFAAFVAPSGRAFFRFLRRIATSPPRVSRATISNDTARILLTFRLSTKKYQRFKAENLIKILIDEDRKKRCNIYPETILNNLEFGRKRIKNRIFYLKKKTSLVDADNNNGLSFSKYTRIRKGRFSDRWCNTGKRDGK